MWEEALKLAIKNGIWAVLFLSLLIYQLKDSKDREKKYQNTIKNLNISLGVVNEIKKDVDNVKKSIKSTNVKVNKIDKNVVKLKSDVNSISQKINLNQTTNIV